MCDPKSYWKFYMLPWDWDIYLSTFGLKELVSGTLSHYSSPMKHLDEG